MGYFSYMLIFMSIAFHFLKTRDRYGYDVVVNSLTQTFNRLGIDT